jgi:hypothetical protein
VRSKPLARRSGRRWLETRFSFDTEPPYYVIAWHILFLTAIPEIRIGFITALHRFGGDNQTIKSGWRSNCNAAYPITSQAKFASNH